MKKRKKWRSGRRNILTQLFQAFRGSELSDFFLWSFRFPPSLPGQFPLLVLQKLLKLDISFCELPSGSFLGSQFFLSLPRVAETWILHCNQISVWKRDDRGKSKLWNEVERWILAELLIVVKLVKAQIRLIQIQPAIEWWWHERDIKTGSQGYRSQWDGWSQQWWWQRGWR